LSNTKVLLLGLFDTAIMTARCFKGAKIDIYGMDYDEKLSGFSSRIIKSIKVPNPKDDEKIWLEFVLNWLRKSNNRFVIIPTSDEFVELIVRYYENLSEFCSALLPWHQTINKIIDRERQFEAAIDCGINVPYFISNAVFSKMGINNKLKYPIAIKPLNITEWKRVFSNKGFVIENEKVLSNTINLLANKNVRYLIQNIIEGDNSLNYEVNSLYLPDGRLFQHSIRKIRQYPNRYGTATCIEACSNPVIEKLASEFVLRNNIIGFSNIEFKFHKDDNKYYYIETNTRVWLQVNFSAKLGLNFPMMYYQYLTTGKIDNNISVAKTGKWVDFLADILFWIKYREKEKITLFYFITSWFPIKSTGLFSVTDPLPFFKDLKIGKRLMSVLRKAN